MIDIDAYLQFFEREYLDSYLSSGGASVKFCVATDSDSKTLLDSLVQSADDRQYHVVTVDAKHSKVQMIEQIFYAVAKQIDWSILANRTARAAADAAGFVMPNNSDNLSVATLAFYYAMDEREVKRDINQQLQKMIFRDYAMVQEFRIAMLRLCQFELETGQVSETERESILAWLTGTLRQVSLLRSARIFRKIARNNARQMLFSLSHWLTKNDYRGLVLCLDISQFFRSRATEMSGAGEFFYTRSAIIDTYESLRQLVDNTDEFSNMAIIVIAPAQFITDPSRGLSAYQALKLRIFDEVRDVRLDNPYAALLRIGAEESNADSLMSQLSGVEI